MREDRQRPALLSGEHRLVVPVGALDQADRDRRAAAAGPVDERAQVAFGVAQVGLDDDAGVGEVAELVFVEQLREDGVGQVAVAELLEVEVEEDAAVAGLAEDRPQASLTAATLPS